MDIGWRESVTGTAGAMAATATLLMAVGYSDCQIPLTVPVVAGMVEPGGISWLLAAFIFGLIREEPGATKSDIDGRACDAVEFTFEFRERTIAWPLLWKRERRWQPLPVPGGKPSYLVNNRVRCNSWCSLQKISSRVKRGPFCPLGHGIPQSR